MSYAKLNIWLRYADCSLITDCWRTDLVINSCCGEAVVDQDPTIIEKLKTKYEGYDEVLVHNYEGESRIKLRPGGGDHLNHIEVEVPPGCYIIWTRVCYRGNEETNKVMVIVGCDDEGCVNLLLDPVETCTNNAFYPIMERLIEIGIPKRDLQIVAKGLMVVAEKPKRAIVAELDQRLNDVKVLKDPGLLKTIGAIKEVVKVMRAKDD